MEVIMRGVICGLLVVVFLAVPVGASEDDVYVNPGIFGTVPVRRLNYNRALPAQGFALRGDSADAEPEELTPEEVSELSDYAIAYARHTGIIDAKTRKPIPRKLASGCACLKRHNAIIGEIVRLEKSETKENLAAVESEMVVKYAAIRANYEGHKTTCSRRNKILWIGKRYEVGFH
jgi:hypothetical protein